MDLDSEVTYSHKKSLTLQSELNEMTYKQVLRKASNELAAMSGRIFDVVDVKRPSTIEYAVQLSKVISKLSPLIGNMIEFATVDMLNELDWEGKGKWIRQDPGFPDALFLSQSILPNPGIEIKAWFPLATEITARFKDSVTIFSKNHINVALIAWLPEYVVFGKPKIIDVLVVSGKSVAEARDKHYHRPPSYIVLEPEDTSSRTGNLQQTNTNGYKLQEERCDLEEAKKFVEQWEEHLLEYSPDPDYQNLIRDLQSHFSYRLDTNYAKIDRIEHGDIELFKTLVENKIFQGKPIKEWQRIISSKDTDLIRNEIQSLLH